MTLGNAAYQKHDWPEAIKAFSRASDIAPESIASWNNLAYALQAHGCKVQAQQALKCGLKISPSDQNLQSSWQELSIKPVNKNSVECPIVQCY